MKLIDPDGDFYDGVVRVYITSINYGYSLEIELLNNTRVRIGHTYCSGEYGKKLLSEMRDFIVERILQAENCGVTLVDLRKYLERKEIIGSGCSLAFKMGFGWDNQFHDVGGGAGSANEPPETGNGNDPKRLKGRLEWWEVLGVPPNADEETIRTAYRTKSKQTHPDTGGNADLFRHIQDAYDQAKQEGHVQ